MECQTFQFASSIELLNVTFFFAFFTNYSEFSDDSIYYKGFIQQLEVRKLKFKKFHEGKCQKFHADLKAYISLGNKLFEEFHFG